MRTLMNFTLICSSLLMVGCSLVPKTELVDNNLYDRELFSTVNGEFNWIKGTKIPDKNKIYNYERFGKKKLAYNDEYIWEKGAGWRNYKSAQNNCQNAVILGMKDWRLPNRNEHGIIRWKAASAAGMMTRNYWTSETTTKSASGGKVYRKPGKNAWVYNSAFGHFHSADQRSRAATRCIHNREDAFRGYGLLKTAQLIFENKIPTFDDVKTDYPKPNDHHRTRNLKLPKKGEYETTQEYLDRKNKVESKREADYKKKLKAFQHLMMQARAKRKLELKILKSKFDSNIETHKVNAIKEAFFALYGAPKITDVVYNADQGAFSYTLYSTYGNFKQQMKLPISRDYAPKLKKILTASSFSPTVELTVTNGTVHVSAISEVNNPMDVVEKSEYKKSRSSTASLNAFKKKYPNSKYIVSANKRIAYFKRLKEEKRVAAIELEKDNASGEIIGTKQLLNAKYLGGRIWEDSPLNLRAIKYEEAVKYCDQSRLLGIKGWRLPSVSDVKELGENMRFFKYVAKKQGHFQYYFTRDNTCNKKNNSKYRDCRFVADFAVNSVPYITDIRKSYTAFPRCVMSSYKYNKSMRDKEIKYLEKSDFNGYLKAFLVSGKAAHIKKANQLATSEQQKIAVETSLVQYFGPDDIFELEGNLNGDSDIATKQDDLNVGIGDLSSLITSMISKGKAVIDFDISKKHPIKVPLRFGKYKVTLFAKLNLTYMATAFGISMPQKEELTRTVDIELNPSNQYHAVGKIDFGKIVQGEKGHFLITDTSRELRKVKPVIYIEKVMPM